MAARPWNVYETQLGPVSFLEKVIRKKLDWFRSFVYVHMFIGADKHVLVILRFSYGESGKSYLSADIVLSKTLHLQILCFVFRCIYFIGDVIR